MKKIKNIFLLVAFILLATTYIVEVVGVVEADRFMDYNNYHIYEGGFDRHSSRNTGYHWTKYRVKGGYNPGIYARIYIAGRGTNTDTGYSSAFASSQFLVDFYHQHTHSKGLLKEN